MFRLHPSLSRPSRLEPLLLAAALATWAPSAHATFSIAAVDPATGEVGSAGASCISGSIILSDVHPDLGVIHTQSFWNGTNQAYARALMDAGFAPEDIIDSLVVNDAQGDPTVRQYGIVDLVDGGRTAGFTGENCYDYKGHDLFPTFVVAGNILLGQVILDDMATAFQTTPGDLADKLMAALQAANVPGADTRCTSKPAISAFIRVAKPGDAVSDLWMDLNVNSTTSSQNPIDLLQELYDDFRGTVGVGFADAAPKGLRVLSVGPNPARADVRVALDAEQALAVRADVFDAAGRRVAELASGAVAPGRHVLAWAPGDRAPSGCYFVRVERLDRPGAVVTRRISLVR